MQRVLRTLLGPPLPRRPRWTGSGADEAVSSWYPNRSAGLTPTGPAQQWVAELTYLQVGRETAFLAVILDAWSRRVIGYAAGPILDTRLPWAALDAAFDGRRPAPGCVHHSDRGTQYASRRYRERFEEAGLVGSMSRAGNPYGNAQVESFVKTLKHEEVYLHKYRTMAELLTALPTYLEHTYNTTRLHSPLGYVPPVEYEQQHYLTRSA